MSRIFVVGPPRSGTTWIARTLGETDGACYVHEPDGDYEPYALRVKRKLPRHVELGVADTAPEYERLWRGAFAGGRRRRSPVARVVERGFESTPRAIRREVRRGNFEPRGKLRLALALARPLGRRRGVQHVVVKSVHASLAAEWIAARFSPQVVVVERHPLNVLASWEELGQGADIVEYAHLRGFARRRWDLELPGPDEPVIVRRAAFLGVLQGALREAATAHPDWVVVRHEQLLDDPVNEFARCCDRLGLVFGERARSYLAASNRPGEGYDTHRVAEQLPDSWRHRLSSDQVAAATDTLRRFPPALRLLDAAVEGDE